MVDEDEQMIEQREELYQEIKERLWRGESGADIARVLGVSRDKVYSVKQGRVGFNVPWPDGSIGEMPQVRAATLARMYGGRGVDSRTKDRHGLALAAAAADESLSGEEEPLVLGPMREILEKVLSRQRESNRALRLVVEKVADYAPKRARLIDFAEREEEGSSFTKEESEEAQELGDWLMEALQQALNMVGKHNGQD